MAKDTFEAAVETAWAHFERTLRARLATMELDDIVFVMPTENTGLRFALRFGRRRHGSLHATIACETTGLDDLIRTSGWRKRTDGRLTCERHQGPAALAEIAAQTLREVWNVPDPSFICDVGRPRPDRAPVIDPENLGPDRFRLLIRDELATFCGGSFPIRSDATIALPTAHFTSSIGISLDAPCIDIFGHLESDVRRPRFTQGLLDDLAGDYPTVEFVLDGTDLWAVRRVDARCFGRDHLFTGLYQWFDFVDNGLPRLNDRLHPAPRLQTVRRGRPAGDRIVNLQPRLQHNSD